MATYPLINGRKYDHSSVEIQIGSTLFTGIESLEWTQTLEPGQVRGSRAEKLARTTGEHDAEGSFSLPLEDFAELIAELGDGYMQVPFNLVANYSDEGSNVTNVQLIGCRITEHTGGSETGGDPAMEEVSIDVMRAEINGLRPVIGMLV